MAEDNFKDSVDKLESRKELPERPETKELPQHEETIAGALPPAEEEKAAAAPIAAAAAGSATTDAQEASGILKTGVWAVVALAVVALGALLYYGSHTGLKHDYNPRVAQADEVATAPDFGSDGLYYYQTPSEATADEIDASGIMNGRAVSAGAVGTNTANAGIAGTPQVVVVYLFGYDKAGVPENADLNKVAKQAVADSKNVLIKAYTDEHGAVAYNKKLSDRRANAIRDYMVKHGVPATNVKAKGMGPTHAYAGGDAQNRRAEISLSE